MDLKTYLEDPQRRASLVEALDTADGYMWQLATGWRGKRPSPEMAKRIEAATCGAVSRAELRPDLWGGAADPASEPREAA